MDTSVFLSNILSPPVLFFGLGLVAVWLRSDLEIPQPLPKLFSLYLLMAIGFKGGSELAHGGFSIHIAITLGAAIAMALAVPLGAYAVLRRRFAAADAAAIAATYGSVSAVTFIAATSFLEAQKIEFGGHMVAAMALMESPAIIVGVALARLAMATPGDTGTKTNAIHWPDLLRDAFCNGSVVVLLGSLFIGAVSGESGVAALKPFTNDIFRGILCLFLLDMGLVSARRLGALRALGAWPIVFALVAPLVQGALGLLVAHALGLGAGDALLFVVLCASASYIAVPAAMRLAVPEANPGVYVPMALAITFPFNIARGLPRYYSAIQILR